jgi:hypothetical protein
LRDGGEPVVTGEDVLRALDTAIRIAEVVESSTDLSAPLPVHEQAGDGYVRHDHHPETREPVFSRTSLVDPDKKTGNREKK